MEAYIIDTGLKRTELEVKAEENRRMLETNIIEIHPSLKKHLFKGFGGALTESSSYVFSLLDETEREKVLSAFFDKDNPIYDYLRVPIDSSDFSLSPHSVCHTIDDWRNRIFDYSAEEKYIFPMLECIYKYCGRDLPLLFSPWSPPSFFKDNNSRLKGGRLKEEFYPDWVEYIASYLREFRKRGFNVWGLTIQNEPNAVQTWDSCIFSPLEERIFLVNYLKPALDAKDLEDVKIYFWDHNKECLLSFADGFMDEESRSKVYGIAFHGYCGDHFEALDVYKREYPEHEMILSEFCLLKECIHDNKRQMTELAHEYINDIVHGTEVIIDWNILLDEKGGPNHVGNYCVAPYMKEGKCAVPTMTYHVIAQLAMNGRGNTVLQTTSFSDSIDCVAFIDDEERITLILLNTKKKVINIRIHERIFIVEPEENTLAVIRLNKDDYSF